MAVLHIRMQRYKQNIVSSYAEHIHTRYQSLDKSATTPHINNINNITNETIAFTTLQHKCSKKDGGIRSATSWKKIILQRIAWTICQAWYETSGPPHSRTYGGLIGAASSPFTHHSLRQCSTHVGMPFTQQRSLKFQQQTLRICVPPRSYLDYGMSLKIQGR